MPEFRLTHKPSARPSLHNRWNPLVSEVFAEQAVVKAAAAVLGERGPGCWYRVDVSLYLWEPPRWGKPGRWAPAGAGYSAGSVHVPGLTDPDQRRFRDHVELLCPVRLPVWVCHWCQEVHDDLPSAAGCAAACWDAGRQHVANPH